jgi:hypothetical protein
MRLLGGFPIAFSGGAVLAGTAFFAGALVRRTSPPAAVFWRLGGLAAAVMTFPFDKEGR